MADTAGASKVSSFWLVRFLRAIYVALRGYLALLGLLVTVLVGGWTYALFKGVEKLPHSQTETLPKGPITLTLDLEGPIAEHSPGMTERFFNMLRGQEEIYIPELRAGLRRAAKDAQVKGLEIRLGDVSASPAEYVEIRRLLADFRTSGKEIKVVLEEPSEWRYYVATVANHIKINPTSSISLLGPAFQLIYFAEALKKVGVGIEVMRAGKYKSAFEPFVVDQPSPATLEQYESMRESLLGHIVETVAQGRQKDPAVVKRWYRDSLYTAKEALAQGMVDELGYVNLSDASFAEESSDPDTKSSHGTASDTADKGGEGSVAQAKPAEAARKKSPRDSDGDQDRVSVFRYASATAKSESEATAGEGGLALIEAVGEISMHSPDDGLRDADGINPDLMHRELRWAAEEEDVKAVILRVSSPGGSAVASDMIWNDVKALALVKPVVVSMGAYAASGGYYISAPASKIIAEPTTVTGSIGVIGMLPNFAPFKDKYGVSFHAVAGTDRVALVNPGAIPSEKDRELIGRSIDDTYKTFVSKVAEGRGLDVAKVEALAQGRVYTGIEALKLGLVDELGGLQIAMNKAKELGGLDPQKLYPVLHYEEEGFDLRHCLRRPFDCLSIGTGTRLGVGPWTALQVSDQATQAVERVVRWIDLSRTEGPLALWSGYVGARLH